MIDSIIEMHLLEVFGGNTDFEYVRRKNTC